MLSVCLATYNGEKYLKAMLDSIVEQLEDGDEIVVSDDGSTDSTVSILLGYGAPVKLAASSRAGGVVKNFERSLAHARGDILVLCDQDDIWLPNRVATIKKHINDVDLIILNGTVVDSNLNSKGITVFEAVRRRRGFIANFFKNSYIGCCMAFSRRILVFSLPFPSFVPWHDWYIGLIAEIVGRVSDVDDVTMLYRRHGQSVTATGEASNKTFSEKAFMRICIAYCIIFVMFRAAARGFFGRFR